MLKQRAWLRFAAAWRAAEEMAELAPPPSNEVLEAAEGRIRDAIAVLEELGVDCRLIHEAMEPAGVAR